MDFILLTESNRNESILVRKKDVRRVVQGDDGGVFITFYCGNYSSPDPVSATQSVEELQALLDGHSSK